jgi:hypothetical protein
MSHPHGAYHEYRQYEKKVLQQIAKDLQAKLPTFYGSITFKLQAGKATHASVKPEPDDATEIERTRKMD